MQEFVTFESRATDIVALKLLVLSAAEHAPDIRINLVPAPEQEIQMSWFRAQKNVRVLEPIDLVSSGWSVKPQILLHCLGLGMPRVSWIDSDIVFSRPLSFRTDILAPEAILVTEERASESEQDGRAFAEAHGFKPQEVRLSSAVNSCIVSVTSEHRDLLEDWVALTKKPDYVAAQEKSFYARADFLRSDQDLLAALLSSETYGHLKPMFLRNQVDIAQIHSPGSYRITDRLRHFRRGMPPLVHAQGDKPWRSVFVRRLRSQLHPYRMIARDYRGELTEEESVWMREVTRFGLFAGTVTNFHPSLVGIPALILSDLRGLYRRFKSLGKFQSSQARARKH